MKSEPSATGSMREASAAQAPPLLPPALTAGSQALRVMPNSPLKVCDPRPNSGTLVLPTTMAPAAFMRPAMRLSRGATEVASTRQP